MRARFHSMAQEGFHFKFLLLQSVPTSFASLQGLMIWRRPLREVLPLATLSRPFRPASEMHIRLRAAPPATLLFLLASFPSRPHEFVVEVR